MNAEQFADKLTELKACQDAIVWAKGKSLSEAWEQCERSDWMFWLLRRSTVSKKVVVAIACDIAESVAPLLATSPAAAEAIKAARQYMAGEITMEELREKRYAASSYAAAAASSSYASYAAAAAASSAAAAAAASSSYASYAAAASASYASYAAASYASYAAGGGAARQRRINCDIIRRHIPAAEIGNLLAAREESGR